MSKEQPRVLIVDDEEAVCDLLHEELTEEGCQCVTALDAESALNELKTREFDAVLLDIRLPGISGMDLLQKMRMSQTDVPAIMITAVDDVDTAVEAMTLGAIDYVVKPLDMDRVKAGICIALWKRQAKAYRKRITDAIDAIARGVEAEIDPIGILSGTVTKRTIGIARRLGVPAGDLRRWSAARAKLDSEKNKMLNQAVRGQATGM